MLPLYKEQTYLGEGKPWKEEGLDHHVDSKSYHKYL